MEIIWVETSKAYQVKNAEGVLGPIINVKDIPDNFLIFLGFNLIKGKQFSLSFF